MLKKMKGFYGNVYIFLFTIFVFASTLPVNACTLWGSVEKSNNGYGRVIFAKNRDWSYKESTLIKKFQPKKGLRYFGIFGEKDGKSTGVKAGINEKGLVVLSATASSLPKKERIYRGKEKITINGYILSNYSDVDEVLKNEEIFSRCNPAFLVVGDRNKAVVLEIAPGGIYSYKIVKSGVFYHTNHYFLTPGFDKYNKKPVESSRTRLSRIRSLLGKKEKGRTIEDFIRISKNEDDGPDNSLWRKGSSPEKSRTLAAFIVEIPEKGFPVVYIRRADYGKPIEEKRFVIEDSFWETELKND